MGHDDPDILRQLRHCDGDAVRAAVECHGRMVYNVCHRVLGDAGLAEDAAQAVFVLLLKKRRALGEKTVLGPWLCRTSEFVARSALRARRRRSRHERAAAMSRRDRTTAGEGGWREIRPVLDRALAELPERLRAPIVLVHLEGRPGAEAARLLGLPQRTFYDRLSRGLDRLRRKLSGSALSLSPAALGAVLSSHAAELALPAALKTAWLVSAGAARGTTGIQLVLEAVMGSVFWSKAQTAAVVALAIVLSAAVTAPVAVHVARGRPASPSASSDAAEVARLRGRLSALEEENLTLSRAITAGSAGMSQPSAAESGAGAAPATDPGIAQLLNGMPWDEIATAVARDAREHPDSVGTSAELTAALLPHLPKLLALQKALGTASIEALFDHDLVQAYVVPIYARELAGVRLTPAQANDVAAIMRNLYSVRQHLDEAELPAYDFLAAAAEVKGQLRAMMGEEAMEKLSAADLVAVTPPPRLQTMFCVDGTPRPVAERAKVIADQWIEQLDLDASMGTSLEPISIELAEAVNSYPRIQGSAWHLSGDPIQDIASELLDAHRQATLRILREVPLTEQQRLKVRHSLFFHAHSRPAPESEP
jgi:RNA polymerase sigma factor (sigma-70 family)